MLNNGKGLILCHLRKVVFDESSSVKSKKQIDNSPITPKRPKSEQDLEPTPNLPTTNMKMTTINLKRQGIPLNDFEKDEVLDGYFRKSRRLLKQINRYKEREYGELYKKLLEDDWN